MTVGLYDTTLRDGGADGRRRPLPGGQAGDRARPGRRGRRSDRGRVSRVSEEDARAIPLIRDVPARGGDLGLSRAVPADVDALVGALVHRVRDRKPDLGRGRSWRRSGSRREATERIPRRRLARGGARDPRRVSSASTRRGPTSGTSALRTRARSTPAAAEVVASTRSGSRRRSAAAFLVGEVAEHLDHEVSVHWHGHDDFGLATRPRWRRQAGATGSSGTVNGMGERAGTPTSSRWRSRSRRCTPSRRGSGSSACARSPASCSSSRGRGSRPGSPSPAPTSSRASQAVAAQFHDPPAIEPYASELGGGARDRRLGKKSGLTDPTRRGRAWPRGAGRAAPVLLEAVGAPARGSAAS